MNLAQWVRKGGRTVEQAIALLRAQPGGPGVAVPLPFCDRAAVHEKISDEALNEKIRQAPVIEVKIADLHAIQHTVNRERVEQYLRRPGLTKGGTMNPKSDTPVDVPVVVKLGAKQLLWDGNHRVMSEILRGLKSTPARLVDLDG